jgi:hypothetical protein
LVETFSVEAAKVGAVGYQPKKTILCLHDLINDPAGQTVIGGEMGTDEAARWLAGVKCPNRNA